MTLCLQQHLDHHQWLATLCFYGTTKVWSMTQFTITHVTDVILPHLNPHICTPTTNRPLYPRLKTYLWDSLHHVYYVYNNMAS